jgi:hypothetical protein
MPQGGEYVGYEGCGAHNSITVINGMTLRDSPPSIPELSAFPTSLTSPHNLATWLEIVRVMACHSLFLT